MVLHIHLHCLLSTKNRKKSLRFGKHAPEHSHLILLNTSWRHRNLIPILFDLSLESSDKNQFVNRQVIVGQGTSLIGHLLFLLGFGFDLGFWFLVLFFYIFIFSEIESSLKSVFVWSWLFDRNNLKLMAILLFWPLKYSNYRHETLSSLLVQWELFWTKTKLGL